ncbi:MAG: hypothetical protein B6I35_03195 [Anaerolineaceae bacterium 4572_32.2]|nr:MAG: hypothetical protein B6I35_03195 [Anaerolineaceae bacterium 4572_32.2]
MRNNTPVKLALIGDVHANLPALEAVVVHARQRNVKAIWNAGDLLGYGPFPNEVIQLLRQERAVSIVGNYDLKVLEFERKRKKWQKSKRPEKFLAFRWAFDHLFPENHDYLRSLPQERRLRVEGLRILLTHGSPVSNEETLTSDTPKKRLRELAQTTNADVIICGHSHRPFARQVEGVWFINTGSVGRPDDGDPRACYAILQIEPDIQVQHFRLAYDVLGAVTATREYGLPEAFAQMLIQGRALDTIMKVPASISPLQQEEERRLQAVLRLAERCDYEVEHSHQVTRLALRLFDELRLLHQLGAEERFWLQCGALLHDIGWVEGQRRHHKTSLRIIRGATQLPFDARERLIIGSIARYHRRALPKNEHAHFAALEPADQRLVAVLAALLRVADGLDRTHRSIVEDLTCEVSPQQIIARCTMRGYAEPERERALDKGLLLEQVFDREFVIEKE